MDGNIYSHASDARLWEGEVYRYGEELKQLESTIKEEGLFYVEWCLIMSVSTI